MKKYLSLLVLMCLLFANFVNAEETPSTPDSWRAPFNEQEMNTLKYALSAANLSIKDLSFEKKAVDDEWRLKTVNRMLDEPLYCSSLADETGKTFYSTFKTPEKAVKRIAEFLDTEAATLDGMSHDMTLKKVLKDNYPQFSYTKMNEELSTISPKFSEITEKLVLSFILANEAMKDLFANMTPEEVAVAMNILPMWATESEGKLLAPAWKEQTEKTNGKDVLKAANKINFPALFKAAWIMSHSIRHSADAMKAETRALKEQKKDLSNLHLSIPTPYGILTISGDGDDTHTADAAILIDLGGDDIYRNNCSSAIAQSPGEDIEGRRNVSLLLDLSGDDRYQPDNAYGCAAAVGGLAMLLDSEGDDFYKAGNLSCGAGILGGGILIDDKGDDIYKGDCFAQGAGYFGFGILAEGEGGDMYRGARFVQGFGYVKGIGVVADDGGVDQYFAGGKYLHVPLLPTNYQSLSQGCGFGMRSFYASGGIGLICDSSGNDTYVAEVYGQATSYWFAGGLLVDGGGNDNYITTQYSVGAGIHLAAGCLLDRSGNDHYYCKNGVGIGGAHDWAVGLLLDLGGDDYYQGAGAAQGTGHTNGVGILLDSGNGKDAYSGINTNILQGGGSEVRNTASIGVLIDMGGNDNYSSGLENGELRVKGVYGVAYDVPDPA